MEKICILALESSTPTLGVALLVVDERGHQHIYQRLHEGSSQHAEHVLPLVDELLLEAQLTRHELTAIAFGQGPGGFTGLRVACGVAQGMALGLGIPVLPISSLLAVAQAHRMEPFPFQVVMIDARMQELYIAAFAQATKGDQSYWQVIHPPALIEAQDVPAWLGEQIPHWGGAAAKLQIVGNGLQVCEDLGVKLDAFIKGPHSRPHVQHVAELGLQGWQRGEAIAPDLAAPIYVRNKVAFTVQERADGQGGNPSAAWVPVAVHALQAEHLAQIAAMDAQLQANPWSLDQLQASMQAGHQGWVLLHGDQVYAFLLFSVAGPVAELLLVGTDPAHQRKGYATWLLEIWQAQAIQEGIEELQLEVRASNQQAQRLYERFGFHKVGVRADYYPLPEGQREDAWLYSKPLYLVQQTSNL